MDLRIGMLVVGVLCPAIGLAQATEVPPPPLPPTESSELSAPPAPEDATAAPPEAIQPQRGDPNRPVRILVETLGSGLIGVGGLMVGGGLGALFTCPSGNNTYCGYGTLAGAVGGFALGVGYGAWVGAGMTGGRSVWWAPIFGGIVGATVTGAVITMLNGLVVAVPRAATAAQVTTVVSFLFPVAGAVIGAEWSHGLEVRRTAARLSLAPILTPQGQGLAVVGAF